MKKNTLRTGMSSSSFRTVAAILFTVLCGPVFGSVEDDLPFETSSFMKSTLRTHSGKWFIEEQRHGADAVSGGIAKDDQAAIERGLKILHWGFSQQQPDGSFACPDTFHS